MKWVDRPRRSCDWRFDGSESDGGRVAIVFGPLCLSSWLVDHLGDLLVELMRSFVILLDETDDQMR